MEWKPILIEFSDGIDDFYFRSDYRHCDAFVKEFDRVVVSDEYIFHSKHCETAKLFSNSVLSRPGEKFMTIDLANFYLMTLMKDYKYLRVKLKDTHQETID